MGRLISVLALAVLLALVIAASACGTDDPFTIENLNSYGVFESVKPGEDFHRVLTHRDDPGAQEEGIKYVNGRMTFTGPGTDVMTRRKTEFNASIGTELVVVPNSYVSNECGDWAGVPSNRNSTYVPQYDDIVGEESVSWVACRKGAVSYRERAQFVTHFVRDDQLYTVSMRLFNQGLPSDFSDLDLIVKLAQDWDGLLSAR